MADIDALKQKIDSEDAWRKTGWKSLADDCLSSSWFSAVSLVETSGTRIGGRPWWLAREITRFEKGVYDRSDVITMINNSAMRQHVVHVSKEDPKMVAYTPSVDDGIRDKQVRTTIGKYLRKYFYSLSDAHIQDLEQRHTAELNACVLWACDQDEVYNVYRNMAGDTGCMRYAASNWGNDEDQHPSAIYAHTPGIRVAYLERERDGETEIYARSVVYDNPDNPADKRYVRIYGAPVLKRMLEREGYACSDLLGVRIKAIPRTVRGEVQTNQYVMPYMDRAGGANGEGNYLINNGDGFLDVISDATYTKLHDKNFGKYAAGNKVTSGYVTLAQMPESKWVSDLTGVQYDTFDEDVSKVAIWMAHTKRVGYAEIAETVAFGMTQQVRVVTGDHNTVTVRMPDTVPTFLHASARYLESDDMRMSMGYRRLSSKYYPTEAGWVRSGLRHISDGEVIRSEDAVTVIPTTGETYTTHKSLAAVLRKQGYVNCSPLNGEVTLISKARPEFRRTEGGTAFCLGLHDKFVELIDGRCVARIDRGVVHFDLGGRKFWYDTNIADPVALVPVAPVREHFMASSVARRIMQVTESVNLSGVNGTVAAMLKKTVTDLAFSYMENHIAVSPAYAKNEQGEPVSITGTDYYSKRTWETYSTFARVWAGMDTAARRERDYLTYSLAAVHYDLVNSLVSSFCDAMDTLVLTNEAEAAGQVRLDAEVLGEDAAVRAESVYVVTSDERYAVAA